MFSMISLAQTKFYVGSSGIFPDRAGKVIAFKATNSRASDTVYFVDVATGAVTDRVADGSFGLEFKMMKAKVLNREKLLAKDLSASYYWTEGGYDLYIARTRDSIIARAWLAKSRGNSDNPRSFLNRIIRNSIGRRADSTSGRPVQYAGHYSGWGGQTAVQP